MLYCSLATVILFMIILLKKVKVKNAFIFFYSEFKIFD